ncbi:hypothetical protein GCK72_020987 [Caenorhabditis remanei]|uniref:Uncharacterized protein n=1 Tax=Caenorhabditis remanei TaxID=31234 RepID=A0A6A5GIB2_CAERE|nr:hypothetical protein GCK72_020987 [Caenorhabditis remanei]KAF1754426.1 hypothetical protein GCK72_020987 [Caenorhabditis remanei]
MIAGYEYGTESDTEDDEAVVEELMSDDSIDDRNNWPDEMGDDSLNQETDESSQYENLLERDTDNDSNEAMSVIGDESVEVSDLSDGGDDFIGGGTNDDVRLIAFVNFFCSESISEGCLKRMVQLMTLLYGEAPPFTASQVLRVVNDTGKKVIQSMSYYCSRCGTEKSGKKMQCSKCMTSNINILDRITFIKCDLKWQLEQQLRYHGAEVIKAHEKIHKREIDFETNDIRRYQRYLEGMESKEQFACGNINLLYTVFSDGAAFTKISRREVTPVLCRLEGIDVDAKAGGNVFSIISMVYCDGGVKKIFVDEFVEKSFSNLPTKIEMKINGKRWCFMPKILCYLSDMKERMTLTKLPNWHQVNGCSECVTIGRKKGATVTYVDYNMVAPRNNSSILYAAEHGIEGFKETGEILKPTSWISFKMFPGTVNMVMNAIEGITPYTYDNVPLCYYNHVILHENNFGPKHTTEVFEREHKVLMNSVHYQSTNSEKAIINKYVCGQVYRSQLTQMSEACSENTKHSIRQSMKTSGSRLPPMNELKCCLDPDQLNPLHKRIIINLGLNDVSMFLSRWRTCSAMGNYIFSAKSYCSAKTTSSSLICFSGSTQQELCFGEIELIVKRADSAYFIVREFILQPLHLTMKPIVDRGMTTAAANMLNILQSLPNVFSKVESSTYVAIPSDTVLCPAVIININGHSYVTMER